MRRTKVVITVLLSIMFLLFLTIIIVPITLGYSFLMMEEEIEPSEAIIVLSGDEKRLEKGVEHYLNKDGGYIILSNSTKPFTTRDKAIDLGAEPSSILEDRKSESTWQSAVLTKEILQEEEIASAIVVTSDYHMRRTKMTFEEIFSDSTIDLYYSSSDSYAFGDEGDKEYRIALAAKEYMKLGVYWIRLRWER